MATYILNEEKMFSDIADGIAIVINSETGIYYGMNSFGTTIFESVLNGASTEDILSAIKAIPGAPEDMEARLNAFVTALLAKELILEGAASGEASIDEEMAKVDDFNPEVKEYDDAQELLLADPIHEVKTETGWTPEKAALETDGEELKAKHSKIEK